MYIRHRQTREHRAQGPMQVADAEEAIIELRRCVSVVARTPYRRLMVETLNSPGNPSKRRLYGQRWKAETLISVVKRKWGEALSARREAMQQIQALVRGVVYNFTAWPQKRE